MDALQLKNKIIQRIIEIDDVNLLKSIELIFNTSDKNISKFISFIHENVQEENLRETEDFTAYIKEWVKSM
ncbi:hypothetical protein Lupro_06495 [Lutibacter profundi]|uniref:Uncharacterized protein n=1 Tax=Lutibacter profundi TaxID=1622118 RepID=A0A120IE88_9FLAO|nr:hypothetical protein [Lutibacter profundi]AMC10915.1 hypothetical protein Lupro_06495 [Lutibacter profundi]